MKQTNTMTNEEVTKKLIETFPEFVNSQEYSEVYESDGPYIYHQYFSYYISRLINTGGNEDIVNRAFDFINSVFRNPDITAEVWDLYNLQILDNFKSEPKVLAKAEKLLVGPAIEALKEQKGRPE